MPAAKLKTKKVSKTSKVTKKSRASVKAAPAQLSWKRVAAIVFVPLLAVVGHAVGMTVSHASAQQVTYDTISNAVVDTVPGTYFEERYISELGSQVSLAGTERNNTNVTVLLTSKACETGTWDNECETTPGATFKHPITLNVYRVGVDNAVGERIATVTKEFDIPYRPTATGCGGVASNWTNTDQSTCHSEKSFTVDFTVVPVEKAEGELEGTVIPMPDNVIISVSYNTEKEGYTPVGVPGPYNYIGVSGTGAPLVGQSLPSSSDAYVTYGPDAQYCFESGPGSDTFVLDPLSMCWGGIIPGIRVASSPNATTPAPEPPVAPTMPKTADECKKDNWKTFTYKFKNQGDCVSSLVSPARAIQ